MKNQLSTYMQKGDFQILPMDGCVWLILEGAVSSEDAGGGGGGRDGGGVLGWGGPTMDATTTVSIHIHDTLQPCAQSPQSTSWTIRYI